MVRVQQPPGGETRLNNDSAPDNLTVRVLKPPGGGSSIVFGEDDDGGKIDKSQRHPQQEEAASPVQKNEPPEINGTATPQTVNDDSSAAAAATEEKTPTPATNGSATVNGSATTTNGSPPSGRSSSSSAATTPTSAKQLDTQNRLFGHEPVQQCTPNRRIRDHYRSNIFTADDPDARANGTTNNETPRAVFCRKWTRRDPVTGVGVLCWDIHAPRFAPNKRKAGNPILSDTPETKTPEPQPQQKQRQRVPPGGFSTQLW